MSVSICEAWLPGLCVSLQLSDLFFPPRAITCNHSFPSLWELCQYNHQAELFKGLPKWKQSGVLEYLSFPSLLKVLMITADHV